MPPIVFRPAFAMSQENLFGKMGGAGNAAARYEEMLVKVFFAPFANALVDGTPPKAGDSVVDIACGTGIVARTVAKHTARPSRIVGVDLNPAMLDVARAIAEGSPVPIQWQAGDMTKLDGFDDEFDVVYCQQGLQFVPDKGAAMAAMRRAAKPGGRIALTVWRGPDHNPAFGAWADAVEEVLGPQLGSAMRSPFAFDEPETLIGLADRAGFTDVARDTLTMKVRYESVEDAVRAGMEATPIAADIAAADPQDVERLRQVALERMAPLCPGTPYEVPMTTHTLTARS